MPRRRKSQSGKEDSPMMRESEDLRGQARAFGGALVLISVDL